MQVDVHDTIAAIASAPGGALRGILRLSGPDTLDCLARCFRGPRSLTDVSSPMVMSGRLLIDDATSVDCDLYLWPTTRSYTRQLAAELHTVGSPPLLQMALRHLCANGARLARPGEFTLRAFLAGRLDLTQAEAVLGVIDAHCAGQLDHALAQLAGGMSQPLQEIRDQMLDLCADLEAGLDFVEDDISFVTPQQIDLRLTKSLDQLTRLTARVQQRSVDRVAPTAVLAGKPNAGKSSLFNALVGNDAAIVSSASGTTRDYVAHVVDLDGISCQLVDTAGLDDGQLEGPAEEAQSITKHQLQYGQLVLFCIDGSSQPPSNDDAMSGGTPAGRLVVITKSDLRPNMVVPPGSVVTSAKQGTGLDQLRERMRSYFAMHEGSSSEILASTASRCRDSLRRATESIQRALELNETEAGDELVAAEIRSALHDLGEVVGEVYTDDILDRVFSRFCIGK